MDSSGGFACLETRRTTVCCGLGKLANRLMRILYFLVQLFDGFTTTTDNVKGVLPQLMRDAGFAEVREVDYVNTLFGTLRLTTALKPS